MADAAISGLVAGAAYAMLGVSIVILFRMTAVLNVAQAVIGAFGTYTVLVSFEHGAPLVLATFMGLASAAALAGACGALLARWFATATPTTKSAVTIALLIGLLAVGFRAFGDAPHAIPALFGDGSVGFFGIQVPLATFAGLAAAIVACVVVEAILRLTATGLALRALADRPVTAELLGIPAARLAMSVWAAAGMLSAFSILVVAPTRPASFGVLSFLVVPGLGAALAGGLRSTWGALLGGLGLGVLEALAAASPALSAYQSALPVAVIVAILLFSRRGHRWIEAR